PSRNALDLLDAPVRMREFFGSRLLKWLTVPYRSRLFTAASKPFYQVADRVLGSRFLQDIAEFFVLFQSMEDGFVRRATQVERLLHDDRTAFVVVSTLEPAPAREARFLTDELRRRGMPLGAMVLNRTLPVAVRQPAVAKAAKALRGVDAATLSEVSSAVGAPASGVAAVLDGIAEHFGDLVVAAGRGGRAPGGARGRVAADRCGAHPARRRARPRGAAGHRRSSDHPLMPVPAPSWSRRPPARIAMGGVPAWHTSGHGHARRTHPAAHLARS
ncbi:MAG: hypothetical protein RI900_1406, partial [Actinomycetota bacterium]